MVAGPLVHNSSWYYNEWQRRHTKQGGDDWARADKRADERDREGSKWGRFAYAYKICRGGAISRPIAWKTHAKISILACNQIKQDQWLDLTIGITGQRGGVPSSANTFVRMCVHASTHTHTNTHAHTHIYIYLRNAPDPPQCYVYVHRTFHACSHGGTMILMFACSFALPSFLPLNLFESWRAVGRDCRANRFIHIISVQSSVETDCRINET